MVHNDDVNHYQKSSLSCLSFGNVTNSSFTDGWHFIAVTWSNNGELTFNLDGVHTTVSTNFKVGHKLNPSGYSGYWYIGSKDESFKGVVAQTNVWFKVVPKAGVRAMSRGVNNLLSSSSSPNWEAFDSAGKGSVRLHSGIAFYLPSKYS